MDEVWSFVGKKKQEQWLWHAIDHQTGKILAYVLAPHVDVELKELMTLLAPFGIRRFYTDGWGSFKPILWTVFLKPLILRALRARKINGFRKTVRTNVKRYG
ncbi:IS1 family transposase [Leptolyngbya sp. PL-A3]|uniref:IS1 family transposase n=1 Tax=Leptolyngbya sp. PL-A3 TaxID=2933911 RepID=UPI003297898B